MPLYDSVVVTTIIRDALADERGAKANFARAVGVTPQTITKWIKGETSPEPDRWEAIEKALKLEPGTIRRRSRSRGADVDVDDEPLPAALTGKLAQLSPRELRAVERMVDGLLGD